MWFHILPILLPTNIPSAKPPQPTQVLETSLLTISDKACLLSWSWLTLQLYCSWGLIDLLENGLNEHCVTKSNREVETLSLMASAQDNTTEKVPWVSDRVFCLGFGGGAVLSTVLNVLAFMPAVHHHSRVKLREKDGINSLPKTIYKISSTIKDRWHSCKCPQESFWLECPQGIWIPPTGHAELASLRLQCLPRLPVFSSCWKSSVASCMASVCFSLKCSSKLTAFCL